MRPLFIAILMLTSLSVFAQPLKYYKFRYIVKEGDNLAKIYRKFIKEDSLVDRTTPMVRRTMGTNKQVSDWANLEEGQLVEIFVSNNFIDPEKLENYKKEMRAKVAEIKRKLREKRERERQEALAAQKAKEEESEGFKRPEGLRGSLFYMTSFGTFNQASDDSADLEFQQNSPVSLGTAWTYFPKETQWSYSGSLYFSNLVSASNNLNLEEVDIPMEVGGNFYAEYLLKDSSWSLFSGVDFDRFHTFNLEAAKNDQEIFLDENMIIYLTAGVSKPFRFLNQKFFTKISLSQSVSSSLTSEFPSSTEQEAFSGTRFQFYLNMMVTRKFYVHTLFKMHSMSGTSDLSVSRFGIGIGYNFF